VPEERIAVVVVDDHAMVAQGLAAILRIEPDFEILGTANSIADAIALLERTRPQVVLMDFHLPDGDGGDATALIHERWPETAVVMLTGSGGGAELAKAIEAGCAGFLVKGLEADNLSGAIRAVARGEIVIHAGALRDALPGLRRRQQPKFDLTTREIEILERLAAGCPTDAIASDLHVALNTVRNHIANVLTKLGAHSRLEAVAIAVREGLISMAPELARD
jgi:DNA-binding NarL/FixJ family response regulator